MSQLYIHTDNPQLVSPIPAHLPNCENWAANATTEQILAAGYRPYTPATPPDGERITESHIEHDAWRAWQVIDATANILEEAEAAAAAEFANHSERYSYGDAFLLLCDRVTGKADHARLTFEELPARLLAIKAANREQYEDLRDAFDLINSACFKKFGLDWWDSCVWIDHPVIIAAAQQILAGIGAAQ
jgi:hypothetical protein